MIDKRTSSRPGAPQATAGPKPHVVKQPSELLPFLLDVLKGQSRTSIKSLLAHQMVCVNGHAVKQFNHLLRPGDKVTIGRHAESKAKAKLPLEVLFEDDYLIVINKPSGLLTIATDDEKQETAYRLVSDYLKSRSAKARVFVLHRLDRDTSGVMMFAKNQEIQSKMQQNWDEEVVNRQYQAVVEGRLRNPEGILNDWLVENKNGLVHVSHKPGVGKQAITKFQSVKANAEYSLLSLTLETGRKNQIRVQLAHIGYPVAGDKKYGAKTSPLKRLALHACTLVFKHPVTGKEMSFKTPTPARFLSLFKR